LSKTIYGTELLVLVKAGKKCFRWFICTASFSRDGEFEKNTPSGRTLQCLRSRETKAEIRSGQVNANRVTNFTEIALSDRVLFFPKEIMYVVITSEFQVWECLGFGGRLLGAPLRNLVT